MKKAANIVIALASVFMTPVAFGQTKPAVELEAAINKEQVDGDLKTAITAYQKIGANGAAPRDVRAKALLHLGGCYEKLGKQAQSVYEQIVRDFGDQPAATQARAKLAVMKHEDHPTAPATMMQRKMDLPYSIPINIINRNYQTDGQRAIYRDDATGALVISGLTGKEKRVVFKPVGDSVDYIVPSRDFSMVLMELTRPDGSGTTAVIKTDGTGYRDFGIDGKCDAEWSWDNRYVLLCESEPDGKSQLVRVSVADGEIRKLWDADGLLHRFSPDGSFIAYAGTQLSAGEISVVPIDGGEPRRVSENARLVDWTRDGRYLVIASGRSGSDALYLLSIKDGKRAGEPVFVRYGSFWTGRTVASGSLVYDSPPPAGGFASWIGTLDSDGRLGGWKQLSLGGNRFSPYVTWSPDSRQIAYTSANLAAGQDTHAVRLRNVADGEERELYRGGADPLHCTWASQHPNLFCSEAAPQDTTELISISIDSGRVERLGSLPDSRLLAAPSHGDQAFYLFKLYSNEEMERWEIGTQQAVTLDRSSGLIHVVSGDERWIARGEKGKIEIRLISGGDWKPLVSHKETLSIALSADGNWLVYSAADAAGKPSVFRVSTAGGQPERLGDIPATGVFLSMSPDGQKIIASALSMDDVWLLENFEPKQ